MAEKYCPICYNENITTATPKQREDWELCERHFEQLQKVLREVSTKIGQWVKKVNTIMSQAAKKIEQFSPQQVDREEFCESSVEEFDDEESSEAK